MIVMGKSICHEWVKIQAKTSLRECGGIVVEHRTPNRKALGSITTGGTVMCPLARCINSLQYWLNPGSVGSVPTWLKNCLLGR